MELVSIHHEVMVIVPVTVASTDSWSDVSRDGGYAWMVWHSQIARQKGVAMLAIQGWSMDRWIEGSWHGGHSRMVHRRTGTSGIK